MGRIEESIEIKAPVDKVFEYTTVAKDWPKWHDYIPEAEQTSQGQVGVGTTFRGKTRMWGLTLEWTGKLIEYEPYKRWRLIVDAGSVRTDEKLAFDAVEGGTKFTIVYDVKASGLFKLLASRIDSSLRKRWKLNLSSLKNMLEVQQEKKDFRQFSLRHFTLILSLCFF